MDYNELNATELRRLLRGRGLAVPALGWDREKMTEMLALLDAGSEPEPGAMTLLDRHRGAIIEWAMQVWPKIYNQVSCPLRDDGCGGCTDYRVVSCLVHNDHVFNVGLEVPMAKWSDVIRLIAEKKTKEATVLLGEMAKLKLVDDRPTKTALTKIVKITLDLTTTGKTKTATEYFEVREVPPVVAEFVKDLDPLGIVQKTIQTLNGNGSAAAAEAVEAPEAEGAGEGEPEDYFPGLGIEDEDPKTAGPGQDATRFLKTNGKPETSPPAATKPPETAPRTATRPPSTPPRAPEEPPKAPQTFSGPVPAPTAPKSVKAALTKNTMGLIAEAAGDIAGGFTKLSIALTMLAELEPAASLSEERSEPVEPVEPAAATPEIPVETSVEGLDFSEDSSEGLLIDDGF